jgi:hypothetical protein
MARRVFFSFHHERDIWRVNQVRHSNVVHGTDAAGFFDHSEYEGVKRKGDEAIKRRIREKLVGTSVTIVLIGYETAGRLYVQYEIQKSAEQGNGFLGIFIDHLKNQDGRTDRWLFQPAIPGVPRGHAFPTYDWDKDLDRFRREIEAAGRRADQLRLVGALARGRSRR